MMGTSYKPKLPVTEGEIIRKALKGTAAGFGVGFSAKFFADIGRGAYLTDQDKLADFNRLQHQYQLEIEDLQKHIISETQKAYGAINEMIKSDNNLYKELYEYYLQWAQNEVDNLIKNMESALDELARREIGEFNVQYSFNLYPPDWRRPLTEFTMPR